jgi:hypothetical protein
MAGPATATTLMTQRGREKGEKGDKAPTDRPFSPLHPLFPHDSAGAEAEPRCGPTPTDEEGGPSRRPQQRPPRS